MDEDDPWLGRMLADRYEIAELIGRGGMAAVYRAKDTLLDRFVAIKIFAAGAAGDDARRRAEVQLLAGLNHPNLVTVHDAHLAPEDSASPSYLVMECVEGLDLRTMMDREALPGPVTALLAAEIAEALVAVHAMGVVHRDLKPANILLVPTGLPAPEYRAKLTDFGIAHLVGGERLTTTGVVIGTAAYLSPEQASGLEPGAEADIYALGLVILECLTGQRPFPGTIVEAISARLAHGPEIPDSLPAGWASLIGQMTQNDPAGRPSAVEVAVTTRQLGPELDSWMPPSVPSATRSSSFTSSAESASVTAPLPIAAAAAAAAASAGDAAQPTVAMDAAAMDAAAMDAAAMDTVAMDAPTQGLSATEPAPEPTQVLPVAAPPPAPPTDTPPPRRGRRRALLGAAAALILIGGGVLAALLLGQPQGSPAQLQPPPTSGVATPRPTHAPAHTQSRDAPTHGTTSTPRTPRSTAPRPTRTAPSQTTPTGSPPPQPTSTPPLSPLPTSSSTPVPTNTSSAVSPPPTP